MHPRRYDEPADTDADADTAPLRERLRHVLWIGGGSGAGKSTVARRLAERHGLSHYATDDVMRDHAARTTPQTAPRLHEFLAMDMDERWLNRPPPVMLETFHWFRGEGFDLIVEDLLRLPRERRVVAEGFRLLPHLVRPLLADPAHAVWLLPTPGFRRSAILSRSLPEDGFIEQTSDPAKARRNLAERDRLFTRHLAAEADRLRLPTLHVDTSLSEDALTERVATAFRL
ncbi:AAA family ATPase [Streptomyces durbertensis]|uniref:AAA family ATPase n=1 Tax=Streptomyces durbertensis TaxID=2448886 RepID=A0ABR6ELT8_9ACTN|nr:AAA family ATPase [Streptomyces durbertensis]MBB1246306.1 AAA family ATPase [Streptomyces durbertensis]